jgi:hypothetical protein
MKTPNPSTNYIYSSFKRSAVVCLSLLIGCFQLLPKAQAVFPLPDGGYPGGNTAEGDLALLSLTTGTFNTGVGFLTLLSNTSGAYNTALGAGTLFRNTADNNTAIGTGALVNNTVGAGNTATGAFALFSNTGVTNVANGYQALFHNIAGNGNTGIGTGALFNNGTGNDNTATGLGALGSNVTGQANTANGVNALGSNTGSGNTAIGHSALGSSTTGHGNTALGDGAGNNVTTASNAICIGSLGADVTNSCFIGNIRGITTNSNNAVPVLIDSAGQLGTASSSRRFKTDIKPIEKASESILALQPVSFRYKVHKDTTPNFGLIAEEVAKVNPDLVIYDADGKPFTVRYDAVNAMLLNEFLKEHRRVEQLEEQVAALTAGLQKVSAQIELSRPATDVVVNQH